MPIRTVLSDFALKNPYYAGASLAVYEVNENLASTGTLATVYAAPTGSTLRANPMVLDSEGKFPNNPLYVEKPVIIEVTPVAAAAEDLGVQGLVSRWRGVWASGTLYYPGERVRDPAGPTTYVVLNGHVSATFLTDVASGLLEEDIDGNSIAAAAAASLFGTVLPNTPVEAYYRVNPAGTAVETRTPTQVRADIGAFAAAGGNITGNVDLTGTGYLRVPTGLTAQRPGSPLAGMLRYNSDLSALEGYVAGSWDEIRGKAYVDAGDRWVSLYSVVPTAVSLIEFNIPTGYDLFRFYFSNLRHAGTVATGKDFYFRLAQGGSLLAGAADYYEQGPYWDFNTGGVTGATTSYGRIFVSPSAEGFIGEATLWPGAGTANTRPLLQARSFGLASNGNHWTVLFGTQCLVNTARATKIGFGWVGGDTFAAQGRIHMMGLKT